MESDSSTLIGLRSPSGETINCKILWNPVLFWRRPTSGVSWISTWEKAASFTFPLPRYDLGRNSSGRNSSVALLSEIATVIQQPMESEQLQTLRAEVPLSAPPWRSYLERDLQIGFTV